MIAIYLRRIWLTNWCLYYVNMTLLKLNWDQADTDLPFQILNFEKLYKQTKLFSSKNCNDDDNLAIWIKFFGL